MAEEQVQGQQTIERVDEMQEPQEPEQKRAVRPMKAAPEQTLRPGANRSYWPFALALVISIGLMGLVIYPIIFFIGMALTVVIIIAWGIERR
ncbi:MAG: hypothetical protein ABI406_14215 [Ktedonobacteraceae bacterium]